MSIFNFSFSFRFSSFFSKFFFLLLFGFLFFSLSSCTQFRMRKKAKVDNYIEMGKSYLIHKNYPASFDVFFKARDLDSKNPVVFNYLGLTYFFKKKYHLAEASFKRALKLDKNYTQARIHLGELYLALGLTRLAIQTLEKASEDILYSQPETLSLNLGIAYLVQKNFSKAKGHFEEVLLVSPKDCSAHIYYGRLLYEQKLYEKALLRFKKSESICKKNKEKKAELLYYKALCYFQLNQEQQAKTFWNEILENSLSETYMDKARKMLKLTL